jgi:hypothetical protein
MGRRSRRRHGVIAYPLLFLIAFIGLLPYY